ncbi:hypothetical protein B0H14DRAFT_2989093, partial [Mycena olivaceomarginata]
MGCTKSLALICKFMLCCHMTGERLRDEIELVLDKILALLPSRVYSNFQKSSGQEHFLRLCELRVPVHQLILRWSMFPNILVCPFTNCVHYITNRLQVLPCIWLLTSNLDKSTNIVDNVLSELIHLFLNDNNIDTKLNDTQKSFHEGLHWNWTLWYKFFHDFKSFGCQSPIDLFSKFHPHGVSMIHVPLFERGNSVPVDVPDFPLGLWKRVIGVGGSPWLLDVVLRDGCV